MPADTFLISGPCQDDSHLRTTSDRLTSQDHVRKTHISGPRQEDSHLLTTSERLTSPDHVRKTHISGSRQENSNHNIMSGRLTSPDHVRKTHISGPCQEDLHLRTMLGRLTSQDHVRTTHISGTCQEDSHCQSTRVAWVECMIIYFNFKASELANKMWVLPTILQRWWKILRCRCLVACFDDSGPYRRWYDVDGMSHGEEPIGSRQR